MTTQIHDELEQVIRDAGQDWLIDGFAPPNKAMEYLHGIIKSVDNYSKQRFPGERGITDAMIVEEFHRNPQRICAFLQAMGTARSPNMLLMAWRILQGFAIREVSLSYDVERDYFHLRVKLATPGNQTVEEYDSSDIDDATLLRHFGIMKMDDTPLFEGFYALRVK